MVGRQAETEERFFGGIAIICQFAFGKEQGICGRSG